MRLPGNAKVDIPRTSTVRALEIHVEGNKSGRLYMIGLERGLTWSPAYSLDISNPAKLKFVSKAVLLNDLGEMKDIEARLVTGFPNVYFLPIVDPLLAANTVEEYVRSLGMADAARDSRSQGFGGMGGQSAGMAMNSFSNADFASFSAANAADSMNHDNPGGIEEGDLFFYRQPHVSMVKGDRAYYILADASLDYKEIYTWESADTISNDTVYGYDRLKPTPNWSMKFGTR